MTFRFLVSLLFVTALTACTTFEVTRPHKDQFPNLQILDNLPRNIQDPELLYEVIDFYENQIKLYQSFIIQHAR